MKKLALMVIFCGVLGCLLFLKPSSELVNDAVKGSPQLTQVAAKVSEDKVPEPSPVQPPMAHSEEAVQRAKSFDEFYREYVNYQDGELKQILGWSKALLEDSKLVEKSSQSSLNGQETYLLITEMRRQGVIHNILTDRELEKFEGKNL